VADFREQKTNPGYQPSMKDKDPVVKMPKTVFTRIMKYISNQPWGEVNSLITDIMNNIAYNEDGKLD